LAASLVFGAGVATVILPIGLGAAALSRLFLGQHLLIYLVGGVLMFAGGVAVLGRMVTQAAHARWPRRRDRRVRAGVRVGGVFPGSPAPAARRCWLVSQLLSGAAASFPAALTIGLAYVAGMVAPLGLAGLWWERHRDRATRLLSARTVDAGGWAGGADPCHWARCCRAC